MGNRQTDRLELRDIFCCYNSPPYFLFSRSVKPEIIHQNMWHDVAKSCTHDLKETENHLTLLFFKKQNYELIKSSCCWVWQFSQAALWPKWPAYLLWNRCRVDQFIKFTKEIKVINRSCCSREATIGGTHCCQMLVGLTVYNLSAILSV